MTLSQAEHLRDIIKEDMPSAKPEVRRIAGNEWVIFLPARTVYIWNIEDYHTMYPGKRKKVEA